MTTQLTGTAAHRSPAAAIAATYDFGIVARRWAGAWIDFAGMLCMLVIPQYVLGDENYQATLAIWVTLFAGYFPIMELLFGRTLGKFLTRTRVVNSVGGRPSFVQVVVRTLFRLIEVNPLLIGGVPAGIAVLASRDKQRLGDMVAGTYVLLERDARRLASGGASTAVIEPPPLPGVA